jgi:hypothetical protein
MLKAIRGNRVARLTADVAVGGCSYAAVKEEHVK